MKLESLQLEKFKNDSIKKEQMFMLNGGGTETPGGWMYSGGTHSGHAASYQYGFDSDRTRADGSTYTTYHNRSNVTFAADY